MAPPPPPPSTLSLSLPLPYRAFFLFIEPISTLVGAYYAHFQPQYYLHLTDAASAPSPSSLPLSSTIVLSQLANLYLAFTLNEALVLRCTSDLRVWRTVLFTLLVADLGHLYSVHGKGLDVYWDVRHWNPIDWGNVAFVYVGACMRISFLLGIGLGTRPREREAVGSKDL